MQSWLMLSSIFSPLSFWPLSLSTPFLIAPGIVLVLADNKGDKCNAYCKSLWLGLGHDTCQPMINWLCVCSISNAKLQRVRERERASELEREKNMMENRVRERCGHIPARGRGVRLRCWMLVCVAQIRHCTSLRAGCPRPGVWEVKSWQQDRC